MTLQLDDATSAYKEFYGPNTFQMPLLLSEGRVPLSVLGVLERRLAVRTAPEAVRRAWHENYFDTRDGIAYHPNGNFKIVPDAPALLSITPESQLRNGALILSEDTYDALAGQEFSKADRNYFNFSLTEQQALDHEALRLLLRGKENAERIIPAVFQLGKDTYGYTKMMGVSISDVSTESPVMRAWVVNRISGRSGLFGRYSLVDLNGRLVGVAPKTRHSMASDPSVRYEY